MAVNAWRKVVAMDPWIGERNEIDYQAFKNRTGELSNVPVERKPFGRAAREWNHGCASFAFIDAGHDSAIVAHALSAVQPIMDPGGEKNFHVTDNIAFAGCRRALFEVAEQFDLVARIPNLIAFRSRSLRWRA